jgi:hypothetical protein
MSCADNLRLFANVRQFIEVHRKIQKCQSSKNDWHGFFLLRKISCVNYPSFEVYCFAFHDIDLQYLLLSFIVDNSKWIILLNLTLHLLKLSSLLLRSFDLDIH